jgi:glucan biosynthesis protein C
MHLEHRVSPEGPPTPAAIPLPRRHDVDWLRTLALGLLIIFHIVLSFQSWAGSSGFPQNEELLQELVPFISMLAIWRIPLLFLISGMGVRFAMERRNWKQLLKDRTIRILIPFIFGTYVLGTLFVFALPFLGWEAEYTLNFGHLWFLANIFLYVVWLLGILVYLKDHPDNALLRFLSKVIRRPLGLFLFALPLMLEAWLVNPEYFAIYVDTVHGWLMGLICFFMGFIFISTQDVFWPAVARIRWIALVVSFSLYLVRLFVFELQGEPNWLTALESMSWILTILGFGSVYLNKPSRALDYFGKAVYPVYIVHLPVQFTIAYFLLPLPLSAYLKLALLSAGTFGVSLLLYEYALRRLKWIRPLFGMKLNQS